jgi:hypothetical protein
MSTVTPSEESASLAAADYQRIDIDWDQLDMRRFILFNALFFTGARSLVYPAGLVKTRLQVQSGVRDTRMIVLIMRVNQIVWSSKTKMFVRIVEKNHIHVIGMGLHIVVFSNIFDAIFTVILFAKMIQILPDFS